MRFIHDLRDKHKGEEIWILGTGPSLDDYPKDFFRGKTTIALKAAIVAFPHYTYSMCHLKSLKNNVFLMKHPKLYKTHIFLYHSRLPEKKYPSNPIFIRGRKARDTRESTRMKILRAVDAIARKEESTYYATDSIAHFAIQAAAVLGAKKITLVGCEDKCRKYGCWAKRVSWFYYESYKIGKKMHEAGHKVPKGGYSAQQIKVHWKARNHVEARQVNRWLATALKSLGVEVALYHYKKTDQYKAGYLKLA